MLNCVFLIIFIAIARFVKRSRVPALFMATSYAFYILVTLNLASDKMFYVTVTLQEAFLCVLFATHYIYTGFNNSKYMAFLSAAGVVIHIYGRMVYGYAWDESIYKALCFAVVSAQIILMLIRPIKDGIFKRPFRGCCLRANLSDSYKPSSKMPIKVGKEEK